MLYEIKDQFSIDMIADEGGPHISLYQPTHRHLPDNKKDLIQFKNLLREIVNSLKQKNESSFIDTIMAPFYALEADRDFWDHTFDGIAVFATKDKCIIYKLKTTVKVFAGVSTRFHIKPLIQAFQFVENYQLLVLSQNNFSLYQGNRYGFSELEIDPDIPRTLADVLGKQKTDPALSQGSFGGVGNTAVFHGKGSKKEEDDKDTEKYFRYVDQYVYENYSKKSKMPLILAALKETHTRFKNLGNNPYLMEECIDFSYDLIEKQQLQTSVLGFIEALNVKKQAEIIEMYQKSEGDLKGSSDLVQVAKAASESQVETLLIEADRIIGGKVDQDTGKIKFGDIDEPDCGDLLDSLAALVLSKKGKVIIVSKENMPSMTGIAAIYRY